MLCLADSAHTDSAHTKTAPVQIFFNTPTTFIINTTPRYTQFNTPPSHLSKAVTTRLRRVLALA